MVRPEMFYMEEKMQVEKPRDTTVRSLPITGPDMSWGDAERSQKAMDAILRTDPDGEQSENEGEDSHG
jgi:hypothetical protein